jgi:hypothetical protein
MFQRHERTVFSRLYIIYYYNNILYEGVGELFPHAFGTSITTESQLIPLMERKED